MVLLVGHKLAQKWAQKLSASLDGLKDEQCLALSNHSMDMSFYHKDELIYSKSIGDLMIKLKFPSIMTYYKLN